MRILTFILVVLLSLNFSLAAQENALIVLRTQGNIDYFPESTTTPVKLLPGMKIKPTGYIYLGENAQINLLDKGITHKLTEKGRHDLPKLTAPKAKQMGFASKFWGFISEGLTNADDKNSLLEYYQQYMAVAGGVRGYVDSQTGIQAIMPYAGKVGPGTVVFNWHAAQEKEVIYHFTIHESNSSELIFKAICRDSFILLDFNKLVFEEGVPYYWQTKAVTRNSALSAEKDTSSTILETEKISFSYFQNVEELLASKTQNFEEYKSSDPLDRQWMEAIIMENETLFYDAYRRYTELQEAYPDNLLIKKLFAAFLTRQGMVEEGHIMIQTCK
jgi:hypothetical protein